MKGDIIMQRQPVSSSRISSVSWEDNIMEVGFPDGAVYQYYDVSQSEYAAFLKFTDTAEFASQYNFWVLTERFQALPLFLL